MSCLLFPKLLVSVICAARDTASLERGIFGGAGSDKCPLNRAVIVRHSGKVRPASADSRWW